MGANKMKKIIRKSLENLILKNKIDNLEKKGLNLLRNIYHCLGKEKRYILEYEVIQDMNIPYEIGCKMQKKRIECAIMIRAAMAED